MYLYIYWKNAYSCTYFARVKTPCREKKRACFDNFADLALPFRDLIYKKRILHIYSSYHNYYKLVYYRDTLLIFSFFFLTWFFSSFSAQFSLTHFLGQLSHTWRFSGTGQKKEGKKWQGNFTFFLKNIPIIYKI